jgi:hypothetical protein
MRVNVYAEEMTDRVEIISKTIDGQTFTGLRFYLELPCTIVDKITPAHRTANCSSEPDADLVTTKNVSGPFIHRPGDDDSAAVTFWGKRDLRDVLLIALALLDEHYNKDVPRTADAAAHEASGYPRY